MAKLKKKTSTARKNQKKSPHPTPSPKRMEDDSSESEDSIAAISASEDEGDDEHRHTKLLDSIASLDGKKKARVTQRTEVTNKVSEFHIGATQDSEHVRLHELVGTLKKTTTHGQLKKQLVTVQKRGKVLQQPLSRPENERIQRTIAYESTAKEVSKWEPVVEKNRKADQLEFPLTKPDLRLQNTDQFVKRFQPRTSLEMEIAALLKGSDNVLTKHKELTPAEEKALEAMSLEEAKERRAELQKYRALLSYKEAKARRTNKIKSKKYHRIMKKEKMKSEKKVLEELEKSDPEAYMEKLKQLDRERIQERMSLKHKGGSKYMKSMMLYGKHNDAARQSYQEMLEKSRELTQKTNVEGSDSDESENEEPVNIDTKKQSDNPWMNLLPEKPEKYSKPEEITNKETEENLDDSGEKNIEKTFSAIENHENNPKKTVQTTSKKNVNKKESKKKSKKRDDKKISVQKLKKEESDDDDDDNLDSEDMEVENMNQSYQIEDSGDELIAETLNRKRTLEDYSNLDEDNLNDEVKSKRKSKKQTDISLEQKQKKTDVQVDPKKYVTIPTTIVKSKTLALISNDEDADEEMDADELQRLTIAQAFASDDVVDEFAEEKREIAERDKPKDIDLTLPGWGEWGGTGMQPSKKKRKRFLIKAPPVPPRKDHSLDGVIVREAKDNSIAKHQVSELPFPFSNVKQFESSIRAPIGKTWNPETAFRKLVEPKVRTMMGKIIEPIDKSEVFQKQKVQHKAKPDMEFITDDTSGKKSKKKRGKKKH